MDSVDPLCTIGMSSSNLVINLEAVLVVVVHGPVLVPDLGRDGSGFAITNGRAVHVRDGHDTTGGGAHEALVTLVRHLGRHELDLHVETEGLCGVAHTLAGDSLQHATVGGVQDTVFDKDNVETGTFGDVSVAVGQEWVVGPAVLCLEHAAGEVTPLEVLDRGVHRTRRGTLDRPRDDGLSSGALHRGLHDPDVRLDPHVQAVLEGLAGPDTPDAPHASGDDDLDKGVPDTAPGNHVDQGPPDLFPGDWQLESHLRAAEFEPVEVVVESKITPVPDGGYVVSQVAVQEALVQQGDPSLLEGHKFAFYPGDPIFEWVGAGREDLVTGLVACEDFVHGRHGCLIV